MEQMDLFKRVLGKWMPKTYDNRAMKLVAMCLFEPKVVKPQRPTKRKFVQVEYAGSGIRLPSFDLSKKKTLHEIQMYFSNAYLFVDHNQTELERMDQLEATKLLVVCPYMKFEGIQHATLIGHTQSVKSVAWSVAWSMSGRLASGSEDNTIMIWK